MVFRWYVILHRLVWVSYRRIRVIRVWCIGCSDACAVTSNEPPDAPVPVLNVAPKALADVPVSMESPRGFIFLNGSYTR